jgi:ParB-like chromosome segregation protein Spo0J
MALDTQTETLAFATELYMAVYEVARKHGKSYEEVVGILARTREAGSAPRPA